MDLDNNSSNILDHQPASHNGHKGQTATLFAPSERIASSTVFNLTDRLPIFSYLMTTNRVRWYRVIMRIFFQRHRELYRYQLTAQEIRDAIRDTFDPEYTLEQCQNDLAALKEWGNVTTIYDTSRATSIASFLSPALLYQATPEAIAIETFLDEQARASAVRGSLRQSDLPRLWEFLQFIDTELRKSFAERTPVRSKEMAEEWQRAFEVWNTMAREAAQYLATMINAAQQGHVDLETFQVYKAAVVAYVQGFAQALTQYSRRIRELLSEWSLTGKTERLIEIIAEHLEPPSLTLENKRAPEELQQEALHQIEAMMNWFAEGKNADTFRRNALAEVDKVVRQATVLASTARPTANYATNLNMLARHLLEARDGETAQQLFSLAFANLLPVHLPESLAGSASAAYDVEKHTDWQEPPTVTLRLRPVSRANRGEPPMEDPVIDNRTILRTLIEQHEERLKEERELFFRLFSTPVLDVGAIEQVTPEQRSLLTQVIDGCLGDPRNEYRAPDGSTIVLLNPDEGTYTLLRAADGVLLLPRYCLQHEDEEQATVEGGFGG